MKTSQETAQALGHIYESAFGGKVRGRFQMSRQSLRELSGRKRLEDVFVAEVASHAFDNGLVLTDFGDDFAVVEVEVDVMRSYRQVPDRVVGEHG